VKSKKKNNEFDSFLIGKKKKKRKEKKRKKRESFQVGLNFGNLNLPKITSLCKDKCFQQYQLPRSDSAMIKGGIF
jgi:predicted N-acyltransferase